MACRSILYRILQFAEDEGRHHREPAAPGSPAKRRADPRRSRAGQAAAYTPEEAGRLLASCPVFWWDHVLALLGTGLRFGELAGLRRLRVHLERTLPVVQVVDVRYQAGRSGAVSSHDPRATPASARSHSPPSGRGDPQPASARRRP
jgi:integrase